MGCGLVSHRSCSGCCSSSLGKGGSRGKQAGPKRAPEWGGGLQDRPAWTSAHSPLELTAVSMGEETAHTTPCSPASLHQEGLAAS